MKRKLIIQTEQDLNDYFKAFGLGSVSITSPNDKSDKMSDKSSSTPSKAPAKPRKK